MIDLKPFENNSKVEGSQYVIDKFLPATIEGVEGTHLMRYNALNDDIEYQKEENKIFVLDKTNKKYDVVFTTNKQKFGVYEYTDIKGEMVKGFLIELYAGNVSLLKREKVKYVSEKYPKSGYEDLIPAHYERADDEFYIKSGNNILAFPKNKKALIKMYPDKKSSLDDFFKKNRVSFKNEKDIISIVAFLSSLEN
ncbi:hypothetical protein [Flavobacterium piscinae]|uniref:hypothetical protein n=1 Tax=Flavobacterium piscinae TaxID=2506424 RepID=UPI0013E9333D|nr:hypothetical protein [Flavobacterium piscinae]